MQEEAGQLMPCPACHQMIEVPGSAEPLSDLAAIRRYVGCLLAVVICAVIMLLLSL